MTLRVCWCVLAALVSVWVTDARAAYVNIYDWALLPGGPWYVSGATAEGACANAGTVKYSGTAAGTFGLPTPFRTYTSINGTDCLFYADAARTQLITSRSTSTSVTATTAGLTYFDGWCNSVESCNAAYQGSVTLGTITVSVSGTSTGTSGGDGTATVALLQEIRDDIGAVASGTQTFSVSEAVLDGDAIQWGKAAHVLQALLWLSFVGFFANGYSVGNRLV